MHLHRDLDPSAGVSTTARVTIPGPVQMMIIIIIIIIIIIMNDHCQF